MVCSATLESQSLSRSVRTALQSLCRTSGLVTLTCPAYLCHGMSFSWDSVGGVNLKRMRRKEEQSHNSDNIVAKLRLSSFSVEKESSCTRVVARTKTRCKSKSSPGPTLLYMLTVGGSNLFAESNAGVAGFCEGCRIGAPLAGDIGKAISVYHFLTLSLVLHIPDEIGFGSPCELRCTLICDHPLFHSINRSGRELEITTCRCALTFLGTMP